MNLRLSTFFIAGLMTTFLSCKDDESPDRTGLLTRKWHITKYEMLGVDVTDAYSDGECEDDDYTEFATDGTFVEINGENQCYMGEGDDGGTWSWKSNQKVLTIQYEDDDPYNWNVVEISSSVMKLSATDDDTDEELTITFTAIQ